MMVVSVDDGVYKAILLYIEVWLGSERRLDYTCKL